MRHDGFSDALWELCDDIAEFPTIETEQVEGLRKWALMKVGTCAIDLLAECLARAQERESIVAEFYDEMIASGLVVAEELHEERRPSVGMDADHWRVQYLEDRIHRYGLLLLILQRATESEDDFEIPQSERNAQNRPCAHER